LITDKKGHTKENFERCLKKKNGKEQKVKEVGERKET